MNRLGRLTAVVPFLLYLSSGTPAGAVPVDLTVMSQNLYIGANTDALLASPDPATAAAAFASVVANNFPKRADAIAIEAASAGGPLLIGLQEAYILSAPTVPTLDYARILLDQLAAKGLHYTIAGLHTGFNLTAGGYGVTLIPQIAADVERRDDRVKLLRLENPQPGRRIGLAFRRTSPRKADFAALGEVVKQSTGAAPVAENQKRRG